MSGALELVWDGFQADLRRANGDFVRSGGLETAVLISVFTNARAAAELAPDLRPEERGGWWGERPEDPFGSLLWLTDRAKRTQETANRAREWVRNSLDWLVREGIAQHVEVETEYIDGVLYITAKIVRGSARRWSRAWEAVQSGTYNDGKLSLMFLPA